MKKLITLMLFSTLFITGCGDNAGEELGQKIGKFTKGIGKGTAETFEKYKAEVSPELKSAGLVVNRASRETEGGKRVMSLYIIFEKDFNGKLMLKAMNDKDLEVGRSLITVKEKSQAAKYVNFPFDSKTPFSSVKVLKLESVK